MQQVSPRGRASGWARGVAVVVLLLAVALGAGDRVVPAVRTVEAFALVAAPLSDEQAAGSSTDRQSRVFASDPVNLAHVVARRLDEGSIPSGEGRTADVRAGETLAVRAHVTGPDGRPVQGAKVHFTWRTGDVSLSQSAFTDRGGNATARRRLPEYLRGRRTVLVVSASQGPLSKSAYTWFVAR